MAKGKKKQKARERKRRQQLKAPSRRKRAGGKGSGNRPHYLATPLPWDGDQAAVDALNEYDEGAVDRMDAILRAAEAGVLPGAVVAFDLFEAFLVHVLEYEKLTPGEIATFLRRTLVAAEVAGAERHFDIRIRSGAPADPDHGLVQLFSWDATQALPDCVTIVPSSEEEPAAKASPVQDSITIVPLSEEEP